LHPDRDGFHRRGDQDGRSAEEISGVARFGKVIQECHYGDDGGEAEKEDAREGSLRRTRRRSSSRRTGVDGA
jgi:hypothetical protein